MKCTKRTSRSKRTKISKTLKISKTVKIGEDKKRKASLLAIVMIIFLAVVVALPEPGPIVDAKVRPENEAQLMVNDGSDIGIILVHGFGASPWEMRLLAEELYDKGYTVYNLRLAGHGTSVEDFGRTGWEQWYQSVRDAYDVVNSLSDSVYVAGLSLGGSLSLLLASNEDLDGVITINAPIWLRDKKSRLIPFAKYFIKSTHKELPEGQEGFFYDTRPTSAIHELLKAMDKAKNNLAAIDEPVLILQSNTDIVVEPKSAEYIFENLQTEKELVWYDLSEHSITRDEAELIVEDIDEFIKRS